MRILSCVLAICSLCLMSLGACASDPPSEKSRKAFAYAGSTPVAKEVKSAEECSTGTCSAIAAMTEMNRASRSSRYEGDSCSSASCESSSSSRSSRAERRGGGGILSRIFRGGGGGCQ